MDSILTDVKKSISGFSEEYTQFDTDIIIHINTVLGILTQMGVGSPNGFSITDKTSLWIDFMPDISRIEMIKSYVSLKVKLIFDPPLNNSLLTTIKESISELEWRISISV